MNPADFVWYENRPPGIHKLGKRWRLFLVERGFLKYTNHFVRVFAITLPSDANVSGHQIMFVSGHSSEQSIAYYSSRPSASQLERVPDTMSRALQREQPHSTQISSTPRFIHSSNRMVSSNVSMSAARASFPSDFFNSCNIQGDVQVYFSLHYRSDNKDWLHSAVFFCTFVVLLFKLIFSSATLNSSLTAAHFSETIKILCFA